MSDHGWGTDYAASALLRIPGQGIEIAPFQIYTTSDIENWRLFQKGVPRESWERYTSNSFGFQKWIKIGVDDFASVAEKMNLRGRALYLHYIRPFSFFNFSGLQNWPEDCYTYLFNGSLVVLHPRTEEYVILPSSPHFREEHLLNHINIALFSETRTGLERVAEELDLPLAVTIEK